MSTVRLSSKARTFYTQTLRALNAKRVPYLVGGAYALQTYTNVERHTKDFDLFVRRADLKRMLEAFDTLGCRTEVTFPHWLAKAYRGAHFFDIIFSSGNGIAAVDDNWFRHGVDETVLGVPVRLVPAEEMIWQKAFIMERERYDGADVAHLIRARGKTLDWDRLLGHFEGPHGRLLLAHLVLFHYIYPTERACIPDRVIAGLVSRCQAEPDGAASDLCRGPLLSRAQYLPDIDWWGYADARLQPVGPMTADQIAHWTAAIERAV
jgi:hypothetical protein